MRILLVNGNTTAAVTETLAEVARAAASPGTEIVAATAAMGAALIAHRAEDAIAEHAVLEAIAEQGDGYDGVLIGVSTDTGLRAARALLAVPVVGMTEAALLTACMLGGRFGLITFNPVSTAPYREVVECHGLAGRLAGLRTIDMTFDQAYGRRDQLDKPILDTAEALLREDGAEVLILAGAATAGLAARLQALVPVPLLDGIVCGVLLTEALVRLAAPKPTRGSYAPPRPNQVAGLSPALTGLLKE